MNYITDAMNFKPENKLHLLGLYLRYISISFSVLSLICFPKFLTAQTLSKIYPQFTEGWEIKPTKDEGFVVMGRSGDVVNIQDNDIVLFKIDPDGSLIWSQHFGEGDLEQAFELVETNDEGFVMAGLSSSFSGGATDVVIFKADKFGNELWQKKYGGPNPDQANDLIQTNDGNNLIAVGCYDCQRNPLEPSGLYDVYVIKMDAFGNLNWSKTFGESNKKEEALGVVEADNGDYIIFGTIIYEDDNEDLFVLRIDKDGNEIWTKTYGTDAKENASAIVKSNDGNYLLGAYSFAFDILQQQPDAWILKINNDGDVLWNNNYGGFGEICFTT